MVERLFERGVVCSHDLWDGTRIVQPARDVVRVAVVAVDEETQSLSLRFDNQVPSGEVEQVPAAAVRLLNARWRDGVPPPP